MFQLYEAATNETQQSWIAFKRLLQVQMKYAI